MWGPGGAGKKGQAHLHPVRAGQAHLHLGRAEQAHLHPERAGQAHLHPVGGKKALDISGRVEDQRRKRRGQEMTGGGDTHSVNCTNKYMFTELAGLV